ncbi:MAG: sugar phosphate isomerase/epimerase family protein [Armatimonadota bacterium]
MIKGISYWSFPGGLDGTKPVRDAVREAKAAGFESIELCLSSRGDLALETSESQCRNLRSCADSEGIQISSVATGLFWAKSLTANSAHVRDEALDIGKKLIDTAHWLDAGAVLVIPGAVDVFFDPASEVVDYQTVWDRATEAIDALLPFAEKAKITIGIENVWSKFLVGPMELRQFIDQFDSQWMGSYFDVGNCMPFGYPEQWIRMLGGRIKRVHFKDFRRRAGTAEGFVDLLAGDVDWPQVVQALGEIGYEGFVTAELIPTYNHHSNVHLANTSRAMDAILGR